MILTVSSGSTSIDLTGMIAQEGLSITRQDVCSSITTMDGKIHRGRIATKATLGVTVIPQTYSDYCTLASLLDNEYVTVRYEDPVLGDRYASMYVEERSAALLVHYRSGTEYWHEISFTLKEA